MNYILKLIPLAITPAQISRIITVLLILLIGALLVLIASKRSKEFNSRGLNIIALLISLVYLIDLFTPLAKGMININVLPFTLGSIMAPVIIVTRFIKPFDKLKPTVAIFSVISLFIYLLNPNPGFNQYEAITLRSAAVYSYYLLIFIYGLLSITTLDVKLNIKECYKELIGLFLIEGFSIFVRSIQLGIAVEPGLSRLVDTPNILELIRLSPLSILISFLMCLIVYSLAYIGYRYMKRKEIRASREE